MKDTIIEHIHTIFSQYKELVERSSEGLLVRELAIPKNKTLGEHLWCVIGARESYAKSFPKGQWAGFSSSLERGDIGDKAKVLEHLTSSAQKAKNAIEHVSEWNDNRTELLLNLLEHETMHEGQIIRLVYGLEESLPKSWVDRWA